MKRGFSSGFTLMELLVALVLLALAMGLAAPALLDASARGKLEQASAKIYSALRHARSRAVTQGETVVLDLHKTLTANDAVLKIIPAPGIAKTTPIMFYPDGSATPARLELTLGDQRLIITIDWLTGRVRQAD